MLKPVLAAITLAACAVPARAEPVPNQVQAVLRAAAERGDGALASAADTAKKAFPKSAAEIDRFVKDRRTVASQRLKYSLRRQGLLRGWKGQAQTGFSSTSGNNRSTGVTAGVNLTREGLKWTHKFNASADYQRDNGVETRGRYSTSFQSNYRVSERLYLLGLASWEDDRFAGYDRRTSESLGFGYTLVQKPTTSLSVEGGPALRQTDYTVSGARSTFASRAAVNYSWAVTPKIKLTQNMSYYGEDKDSTITSNTALTVGLIGALSLQASYMARFESDPPTALKRYDGTARTSLVYAF